MITLSDVITAANAFNTTTLPELSDPWHVLRRQMVDAIVTYAAQEGITVQAVVNMVEGR